MNAIPFNIPAKVPASAKYVHEALAGERFCGGGVFARRCETHLQHTLGAKRVLLTPSCTDALEMMAILADINEGDEVILPSYTFVSTANAFALRGARLVFVDIRPDTMNMDETLVEAAITERTRAVVVVHYGGVGCAMEPLRKLCDARGIFLFEDAAQGVEATWNGAPLGSIGHLGAFSFHETKNIHCGEGGALIVNDQRLVERAEVVFEKGTNRSRFLRGQVDKYTWVELGSSFLMPELSAAFLLGQLEASRDITDRRLELHAAYHSRLRDLAARSAIELPPETPGAVHNAHMFYVKAADIEERSALIEHLASRSVQAVFHYVPLHIAPAGLRFGRFSGEERYTTSESERLLRLPLYHDLTTADVRYICNQIIDFY